MNVRSNLTFKILDCTVTLLPVRQDDPELAEWQELVSPGLPLPRWHSPFQGWRVRMEDGEGGEALGLVFTQGGRYQAEHFDSREMDYVCQGQSSRLKEAVAALLMARQEVAFARACGR